MTGCICRIAHHATGLFGGVSKRNSVYSDEQTAIFQLSFGSLDAGD
jgi:hypothetical protein